MVSHSSTASLMCLVRGPSSPYVDAESGCGIEERSSSMLSHFHLDPRDEISPDSFTALPADHGFRRPSLRSDPSPRFNHLHHSLRRPQARLAGRSDGCGTLMSEAVMTTPPH
ncbi:hypothetical protein FKP32DRAFT_980329 [Trametes sanguinea]|nr:hypothetical protein FKP32DRAFT_980329 [Trametes sanguinea]